MEIKGDNRLLTEQNVERGVSSNRPLIGESEKDSWILGELDMWEMKIDHFVNKRVLSVGVGGGRDVEQGLEMGLDIYGVDVLPIFNKKTSIDPFIQEGMNEYRARRLKAVGAKYPGRILASDAGQALPFADDSFDIVYSYCGMPGYSRTNKEAVVSILEMLRVAKTEVIFSGNISDKADMGIQRWNHFFPMKSFLVELNISTGITYEGKRNKIIDFIRIDLSRADKSRLSIATQGLIEKYGK